MSDSPTDAPSDLTGVLSPRTMRELPFALVVADARAEDMPLIYVNPAFERITGYASSAVLGRNCRFLQGPETDPESTRQIRDALQSGREATVDILNYRSNGEKFINRLLLTPLRDADGEISHFLGIQSERDEDLAFEARARKLDESLREVQHRVKNHLAMLLALIKLESRKDDTSRSLDILHTRVQSLNLLYDELSGRGTSSDQSIELGAYVSRVCSALNMLDGHRSVIVNIDAESIRTSVEAASQVGLLLSELLTNALQHAFDEDESGKVDVRLFLDERESEELVLCVADDGRGLAEGSNWPQHGNLGARITRDLVARLGGEVEVDSSAEGTRIDIRIPREFLN